HLDPVAKSVQTFLGLEDPYHDPGVAEFGLENSVFAVGSTFVEVISPVRDGTTAGRYLERRGGDGGYMAIFQVPDVSAARERIAAAGRWAAVLGCSADGARITLDEGRQEILFVSVEADRDEGISAVRVRLPGHGSGSQVVAGVRFDVS